MTATYEKIATTTLGSAQASTTFSTISGAYTDLVLIVAGVTTSGTEAVAVQVNGDTGSNYSRTVLLGNGSAASSSRATSQTSAGLGVIDSATAGASKVILFIIL
jgi:microcompartment protein CcmK/EutM